MDLVLKGRGIRITDQMRAKAEAKLAKIGRTDARVTRLELEVTLEHNPRIDGRHRIDLACERGARVFRVHAVSRDVDGALDQAAERLERRLASYRDKMKDRRQAGPLG